MRQELKDDPIFSYFQHRQCDIKPAFLKESGVLRGYQVSFSSWYFIYLFDFPSTLNVVEFAATSSSGFKNATFCLIKTLKEIKSHIPQVQKIIGTVVEPTDEIEINRFKKLMTIFEKAGVVSGVDDLGYPCLIYE